MKAFAKYAAVLASGLSIGFYLHEPPRLETLIRLPSLDELNLFIREAIAAAQPKATVAPIDPAAAERVDEELDYRIAQRTKSLEGWRAFLAAHRSGLYAQDAKAKIDMLVAAETPPADDADRTQAVPAPEATESRRAAEETNSAAPLKAKSESAPADQLFADTQVASLKAAPDQNAAPENGGAADPSPSVQAATLPHDEIDQNSLNGLSFQSEAASTSVPAKESPASARTRGAASFSSEPRAIVSSHRSGPSRRARHCSKSACSWPHPQLPPILMALLGEKPRGSGSFGRIRITDRPNGLRGR